jgi:GDP-L-fucose synthase
MQKNARIFIVGHNDSVENSLLEGLTKRGFTQVETNGTARLDVLNQAKTAQFFKNYHPDYVFLGSIRSGGIGANMKYPAEFIYENCQAQNNVIHSAYKNNAKKLLYFTGSCAYPALAAQPIKESSLLTGELEKTSEPYSVAKIAGTVMCQAYRAQYGFNAIVAVPATLYGPGSDSDLETAHVLGALIAKFDKAVKDGDKEVIVWGTGKPRREFLYVDDFVSACMFLMDKYDGKDLINMGTGVDVTIKELAFMVAKASGFQGKISFDTSKPDGTMRKLMDNTTLTELGWTAKTELEEGINKTYQWYTER